MKPYRSKDPFEISIYIMVNIRATIELGGWPTWVGGGGALLTKYTRCSLPRMIAERGRINSQDPNGRMILYNLSSS